jgi:hypothetical protein
MQHLFRHGLVDPQTTKRDAVTFTAILTVAAKKWASLSA